MSKFFPLPMPLQYWKHQKMNHVSSTTWESWRSHHYSLATTIICIHHNESDGVSNHQPHDCLLNHSIRRRSKKTSKLRVTGLCAGDSPVTGEFRAQMASNVENVSIWWRHHARPYQLKVPTNLSKDWQLQNDWTNIRLLRLQCCVFGHISYWMEIRSHSKL